MTNLSAPEARSRRAEGEELRKARLQFKRETRNLNPCDRRHLGNAEAKFALAHQRRAESYRKWHPLFWWHRMNARHFAEAVLDIGIEHTSAEARAIARELLANEK